MNAEAIKKYCELEGESLLLRSAQETDYPALERILNDKVTMEHLIAFFGREVWTTKDIEDRYENFRDRQAKGLGFFFVVTLKSSGEIVGNCALKDLDVDQKRVELGIILDRSVWGQGVAREVHLLLLTFAFEALNLENVLFKTAIHNVRMNGFFHKMAIPRIEEASVWAIYDLPVSRWPHVKALLTR